MTGRYVAIGVLVVTLAIVGAFMAIVLIGPRDGPPLAGADPAPPSVTVIGGGQTFVRTLGEWRIEGKLVVLGGDTYRLTLDVTDAAGQPAPASVVPSVRAEMLDHAMGSTTFRVEPTGVGAYRASGTLAMEGRWRFRIAVQEKITDVVMNVRR